MPGGKFLGKNMSTLKFDHFRASLIPNPVRHDFKPL